MAGLLLLVIVGVWLAVLVPMALKSYDNIAPLRSADRFSDAMRVLSRRSSREVLMPRRSYESLVVSETKSPRSAPALSAAVAVAVAEEPAPVRRTAAQRRLRTLLVLVGAAVLTLLLGLLRVGVLLAAHGACDLLLVAFVVQRRHLAVRKAPRLAREARRADGLAATTRPARRAPRTAGIPDRMPARPAPLTSPLPAAAARHEDKPVAGTGTDGTWSPVPVPPPIYVGKAAAPSQEPRVPDLAVPGQRPAVLEGEDSGLANVEQGPELADIVERRRAVNGW